MTVPDVPAPPAHTPACYRHPDRVTYVRCTRCGRFVCGECMRAAAVGQQCVDCVHDGARSVRTPRTAFGGRQRSATPVLTYGLIGINVAMYLLQTSSQGAVDAQLAMRTLAVADGQWYRMLTSAFLHYGLVHLLFNMWALYVVGPPLEAWLGRARFASLYLLSALGGSVAVYLLSSLTAQTAGASGAVFGLFGATFVIARRMRLDVRAVGALIVLNLAFTFVVPLLTGPAISWQGHIGGLVTGALIAAAYAYAPRQRRTLVQAGATASVVVVLAVLVAWRTGDLWSRYAVGVAG